MSSNTSLVQITSPNAPIPTTTPHLMPFHIEYTGPAPLSTYFLTQTVPPEPQPDSSLAQRVKTRFIAAFRGRKMHGLKVDLPDGFGGVVLQSEGHGEGRGGGRTHIPSKGRRSTRKSKKDRVLETEDDDVMMTMQDEEADANAVKTLRPAAKFASFTLWNADVSVDEETDEYLRFLSEYQRLSAEIHRNP